MGASRSENASEFQMQFLRLLHFHRNASPRMCTRYPCKYLTQRMARRSSLLSKWNTVVRCNAP